MIDNTESTDMRRWLEQLAARIVGMILLPRRTLERCIGQTGFWSPILIVTIVLLGSRLVMLPRIYEYYASTEFHELYKETHNVDDRVAYKEINKMTRSAPFLLMIEAPLTVLVGTAGLALIFSIVGKVAYKRKVPYRRIFSMVAWSSIISALPLLLNIPLKLANQEWYLPTNLSVLLTSDRVGNYMSSVFSVVDLFLIWQAYLLSIGLTLLYEINIQRAVSAVGTMFICFAVLSALLSGPG